MGAGWFYNAGAWEAHYPNLREPITALLIMGTLLFGIAVILFNRQGMVQK